MAWILSIFVALIFLALMVNSPGFRYFILGLVALIAVGGFLWYEYNKKEERRRFSAISLSELELRDLVLQSSYGYELHAVVKNNSPYYDLESLTARVTILDCPEDDPVDWQKCEAVGQDTAFLHGPVPRGQVRKVDGYLSFGSMAPIKRRFVWTYDVVRIMAK